mmetsp:Transcript_25491/g.55807  ORF Transcript_25491/g.55807 Transcript_25491/m.55807 type:complete len:225 (-) Transcript_25491:142-816(-)
MRVPSSSYTGESSSSSFGISQMSSQKSPQAQLGSSLSSSSSSSPRRRRELYPPQPGTQLSAPHVYCTRCVPFVPSLFGTIAVTYVPFRSVSPPKVPMFTKLASPISSGVAIFRTTLRCRSTLLLLLPTAIVTLAGLVTSVLPVMIETVCLTPGPRITPVLGSMLTSPSCSGLERAAFSSLTQKPSPIPTPTLKTAIAVKIAAKRQSLRAVPSSTTLTETRPPLT